MVYLLWEKGSGIASVGKRSGITSVGERKCYSFCGRKEVV